MPKLTLTASFISALVLSSTTLGYTIRITEEKSFNDFQRNVNQGTSYSGTTIILDEDISFSGSGMEPIGTNYSNDNGYFTGVFDGQGYTISSLTMNTNLSYAGLFGFVKGDATIRNVVINSGCSFETQYDGAAHIGGIVGHYFGTEGNTLNIENCINMANLLYPGSTNNSIYIGGIIGEMTTSGSSLIKNCINYGDITVSGGNAGESRYIGGIAGIYRGSNPSQNNIGNSFNHGAISATGTEKVLYTGGLVGQSDKVTVKNCLSAGKITRSGSHVGSLLGEGVSSSSFTNCYWTSEVGVTSGSGSGGTIAESSSIATNEEALNKLNANVESGKWSKWLIIGNSVRATFKANANKEGVQFPSGLAIIPEFESGWREFEGWFDGDNKFSATSINGEKTLTGRWTNKEYKLTFDFGDGTKTTETHKFGDAITYPEVTDTADKVFGWEDKSFSKMPGEDTTVKGFWLSVSRYVEIIFDRSISQSEIEELIKDNVPSVKHEVSNYSSDESRTDVILSFPDTAQAARLVRLALDKEIPGFDFSSIDFVFDYDDSDDSDSSVSHPSRSMSMHYNSTIYVDPTSQSVVAGSSETKRSETKGSDSKGSFSLSSSLRPLALLFLLR